MLFSLLEFHPDELIFENKVGKCQIDANNLLGDRRADNDGVFLIDI